MLGGLILLLCVGLGYAYENSLFLRTSNTVSMEITFYGAKDNCPPGGDLAYPAQGRKEAGGLGTFKDPITFAGTTKALKKGTIVYIKALKKYFIHEDECQECGDDWDNSKKYHIDLWLGPVYAVQGPELIACENGMSGTMDVEINAADGQAVDTTPIFDASTKKCIKKVEQCTDVGNKCGNHCKIPKSYSCTEAASIFGLTLKRFEQLNSKFDCSKTIAKGKSVCQGGSCGD